MELQGILVQKNVDIHAQFLYTAFPMNPLKIPSYMQKIISEKDAVLHKICRVIHEIKMCDLGGDCHHSPTVSWTRQRWQVPPFLCQASQ